MAKTCFSFSNAHYVKDLFNFRQLAVQKERNDLICQLCVLCSHKMFASSAAVVDVFTMSPQG